MKLSFNVGDTLVDTAAVTWTVLAKTEDDYYWIRQTIPDYLIITLWPTDLSNYVVQTVTPQYHHYYKLEGSDTLYVVVYVRPEGGAVAIYLLEGVETPVIITDLEFATATEVDSDGVPI